MSGRRCRLARRWDSSSERYLGAEAILEYFERVGQEIGRTLHLERLELLANNERGAAFLRVTGERGGHHLDVTMAEAFRFDDSGRIEEISLA